MDVVRNWWDNLQSEKRTNAVRGLVVSGVILFAMFAYMATGQGEKKKDEEPVATTAIALGDNLIEDDLRKQIEADRESQTETNEVVTSQLNEVKDTIEQLNKILTSQNEKMTDVSTKEPLSNVESRYKYPPPPGDTGLQQSDTLQEVEPVHIGGIAIAEGEETRPEDDAKKKSGVYLAPGFMEGMLLTGLKAETVESANENPEPMIVRVQAPAVLPNHVKANLKGCFVIAHGFGKLNKERIEARLVSLHCLSQDEEAVIDERIKGFIVDGDGTKGIAGRVVTKAGANTARAFVAGVFGGFGEGIEASNTNVSINPLGAVNTTTKASESLKRGIGRGLSEASDDLRKVFLDLVKQSSPIIEVGPAKKITLALTEGVYLHIRDINEFKKKGK